MGIFSESSFQPERKPSRIESEFKFEPTDALVTFGRGIEQVRGSGWKGTRLIQELVTDKETGRGVRTGHRKIGRPFKDFNEADELKEMAAGANANILATLQWLNIARSNGKLPKEIIFSGGRPGYLEKHDASISEASVMSKEFKRRALLNNYSQDLEVQILTNSKNTADDLVHSLTKVLEAGHRSVTIINVSWAMERTQAFYDYEVLPKHPELRDIKVNFVTSDELLLNRYGHRAAKILAELKASKAYDDTLKNEKIGKQKVIKGSYGEGRKPGAY